MAVLVLAGSPAAARADLDGDGSARARTLSLPILARIGQAAQTPLVVRGDLRGGEARRAVSLAREILDDVTARFVRPTRPTPAPVQVCVLGSQAAYDAFVATTFGPSPSRDGFFSPAERVAVVNWGRGPGNLRHELTHVIVADDFPRIPAWLTEGLGALYGSSRRGASGYRGLVNYRLRAVQAALAAGRLPGPDRLAASSYGDLHGPEAATFYGTARYVLLYLETRGRLDAFYRSARDGAPDAAEMQRLLANEIDWAQFERWLRGLVWPPDAWPRTSLRRGTDRLRRGS